MPQVTFFAQFQSTLPAWGATAELGGLHHRAHISIHAPRVGSDHGRVDHHGERRHFNPRSPRGERHGIRACGGARADFNPRSPRGERLMHYVTKLTWSDFNPRSPRGERRDVAGGFSYTRTFQSTLPAWGATTVLMTKSSAAIFQSTLPAWGATRLLGHKRPAALISIHAPRVGSDEDGLHGLACLVDFNPRSPRGERRRSNRRAHPATISIHAPRVGSDERDAQQDGFQEISIHAPRVGSDVTIAPARSHIDISIHAPRVGSDVAPMVAETAALTFQSTLPAWGATASLYGISR